MVGHLPVGWRSPRTEAVLAGALAFVLFLAAGNVPLLGRDEGRFAQASREMLLRGDPVVPTFAGAGRYDKPILIYWCTMASYAVFGVNERAARLPSNLAGAFTIALLAFVSRRRWGPGWGLLAGLLLAATLVFHAQARAATADMVTMFPTLAAMFALGRLDRGEGGWPTALVFWLAMAAAVLGKGPVGPFFVVTAGIALWALRRRWRRPEGVLLASVLVIGGWFFGPVVIAVPAILAAMAMVRSGAARRWSSRLHVAWGLPLFLVIVLPWVVLAAQATDGELLRVGIGRHVIARSLTPLESHGGFPGFYLVTAVAACLPWIAFLPQAVRERWSQLLADREGTFLLAWTLGPMVALELVRTKLVHYWMPSYPAAVLLVVGWLVVCRDRQQPLRSGSRFLLVIGALMVASAPMLAAHRLSLEGAMSAGLAAGLALVLGALAGSTILAHRPAAAAAAASLGSVAFVLLLAVTYLPAVGRNLIAPRAAARAMQMQKNGEPLVVYKARDDEIFFYLPPKTESCRTAKCLEERLEAGAPFLGLARLRDLDRFRLDRPDLHMQAIDVVEGVELGRVRWQRIVLFRAARGAGW